MSTTAARERQARELRDQDLLLREIAERMGLAISTVQRYLGDPGGVRMAARKRSYRRPCIDCGKPCYADSTRVRSIRCSACSHALATEQRKWTRESVTAAVLDWTRRHGRPPTAEESRSDPTLPNWNTTFINELGGWRRFLVSLGLKGPHDLRGVGRGPNSVTDDDVMDAIWAFRERGSLAGAALALGVSKNTVSIRMRKHPEGRRELYMAQGKNGHQPKESRAVTVLLRELERSEAQLAQKREDVQRLEAEMQTLREALGRLTEVTA